MKQIRVICRAVILDKKKEKVLLVRNKRAKFWYPAGGGWEPGESMTDCVEREVLEETGLTVSLEKLLYVQQFSPNTKEVHLEMFWLAYPTHDSELPSDHVDTGGVVYESRWFSKEELRSLKVFPEVLKNQIWSDISVLSAVPNQFFHQKKGKT